MLFLTSCLLHFLGGSTVSLAFTTSGVADRLGSHTARSTAFRRGLPTAVRSTAPATAADAADAGPFQITTPIYYVNDRPHIGHAYTSLACDVLARYMRLSGREVFFLTGTDEHGQKVEQSAANRGLPPQEFCDEVSASFRSLLGLMDISHDYFVRTTDAAHKEAVQHFWKTLADRGAIYLGAYEGWYSVRDECYYNESELVDGKAPTGAEVAWVTKEPSYFFRLSEYQDKLLAYYEDHPDFIAPTSRRNEVLNFVKDGLRDLSISRTSFKWGVPVPDDDDHVMYVWIDALTNYMSALGYPNDGEGSNFAKYWPASLHVVGKDILRFHAIYWPAFLMAADLPLPKRLFAHGWWTKEGEKISKSLGNVIDPVDLVHTYGVDPTRFFLMSEVTFGADGDFSDDAMIRRINSELANSLGNLLQRVVTLAYKNCNGAVPTEIGAYTAADEDLLAAAAALAPRTAAAIDEQAIHRYSALLGSAVRDANKYIDVQAPWVLNKTDRPRRDTVLYVLMEVLRRVAILYQPLIPASANKILDQLAVPADARTFAHLETSRIAPGAPLLPSEAVFPRIDIPEDEADAGKKTAAPPQQKEGKPKKQKKKQQPPAVARDIDISVLDIRVGVITRAWDHEEADKLFCEEIDIGEEGGPRKIASGLRAHYGLEALVGQRVLVVANLKTRKLVGFPSHGMVMCASNGDGSVVEFVEPPPEAAIGERVSFEGYEGDPASENQVIKKKMLDVIFPELKTDDGGVATYKGVPFTTVAGVCKAQSGLKNAAVS